MNELQYVRALPQRAYRTTQAPGFVLVFGLAVVSGIATGLLLGFVIWG